jgi:hypothetical protein
MRDVDGLPIASFRFENQAPWPPAANGFGPTLEFDLAQSDQSNGSNWFEGCNGGSPGMRYVDCSLSVNEVKNVAFSVRPNVGNGPITVNLFMKSSGQVQISLLDLGGRTIVELQPSSTFETGRHQLRFDLSNNGLENGLYFINVKGNTGLRTERFLLAR